MMYFYVSKTIATPSNCKCDKIEVLYVQLEDKGPAVKITGASRVETLARYVLTIFKLNTGELLLLQIQNELTQINIFTNSVIFVSPSFTACTCCSP